MVRQIALADSRLSQVSRLVTWLRTKFAEPARIACLAELVTMSPVQYQEEIRLQTARARLLA